VTATAASPRTAPRLADGPPTASEALIATHTSEWSAARLSSVKTLSARRDRTRGPPLPAPPWATAHPNTARMRPSSARQPAGARDVGPRSAVRPV